MMECKIFVQEDCATSGDLFNKFLKYPGVKITIGSAREVTVENMRQLQRTYEDCKFVKNYRFSNANDKTCDFYIFKEKDYDRALQLSKHPLVIRQKKVVIVLLLEREFVSEENFKVASWQFVSEYVRQFLKLPEKVEKPKKERKQKESEPEHEPSPFEYRDIHSPFEEEETPDEPVDQEPF